MTTSGKSEHVSQNGPQKIIRSAKRGAYSLQATQKKKRLGSGGVLRVLTGGKKIEAKKVVFGSTWAPTIMRGGDPLVFLLTPG